MLAQKSPRIFPYVVQKRRPMVSMQLKTARKLAGLTQQELATRAGVDDTFISVVENGKRDIHAVGYATVVRLARALGVEPEELFPVPDQPALAIREK